jgi:hypothetical protein
VVPAGLQTPLRLTYLDCAASAAHAQSKQLMRSGVMRRVESRRAGKRAKEALAKHTLAIEIPPQPADDLPSEIAQSVLT